MSKITNVGGLLYSPAFYYKEGINYVRYYFNNYIFISILIKGILG